MDLTISLKNWPDEAQFTKDLTSILNNIGLSNVETQYDLTEHNGEEGLDSWIIRDLEAIQDIIQIVLDNSLKLHVIIHHPHPALFWVVEQITHHLGARDDTITSEKTPNQSYIEWCKANWIGTTSPQAFQQKYQSEAQKSPLPCLEFLYSDI